MLISDVLELAVLPGRYRVDVPGQKIVDLSGAGVVVDGQSIEVFPGRSTLRLQLGVESTPTELDFVNETGGPLPPIVVDELELSGFGRCHFCGLCLPPRPCRYSATALPVALAFQAGAEVEFDPEAVTIVDPRATRAVVHVRPLGSGHRFRGRVVSAPEHDPVGGALISAEVQCPNRSRTVGARTHPDGTFSISCPSECAVRLHIRPPDPGHVAVRGLEAPCALDDPVIVELQEGARVSGEVRDAMARRVSGLRIGLSACGRTTRPRSPVAVAVTDAEGRFTFAGLAPGCYDFILPGRDDAFLVDREGRPAAVDLDAGDSAESIELRRVGAARLCVEAVDPSGEPVPLDLLELHPLTATGESGGPLRWRRSRPRSVGPMCAGPLPPGTYLLHAGELTSPFVPVWWPGEHERRQAVPIDLRSGDDLDLRPLEVMPAGLLVLRMPGPTVAERDEITIGLAPAPTTGKISQTGGEKNARSLAFTTIDPTRVVLPQKEEGRLIRVLGVPEGRWLVRVCLGKPHERSCGVLGPVAVQRGKPSRIEVAPELPSAGLAGKDPAPKNPQPPKTPSR
ncbi:MAG: carboxypeptidase regulatory-like domain-containing protein [Planctomycetota bacterium]|nr:MAG: carboxypeptidase regulatory-like domain-containing protein [Planctomycetota bacterium]